MANCASILLAAGASTRLGKPKQLLKLDGESLLRRTARMAVEAGCGPNLVVLGAAAEEMGRQLEGLDVETVVNEAWREGMGSSLRCAIAARLAGASRPDAVLLLVCDQPNVTVGLLRALMAEQGGKVGSIAASRYEGVFGVPAVFGAEYFAELAELSGDRGARGVVMQHAAQVRCVDFPGGEFDVDTLTDAELLS